MFAPISAIFGLFVFSATLPNGIRLVELPAGGDSVEIVAGYTSGGLTGFASTPAAKSLLVDAYAAGGMIDLVNEVDRSALRLTVPKWALPMVAERLPDFFQDVPKDEKPHPLSTDFRDKVEEEIRSALLGSNVTASGYATGDAFVLISAPIPNSLRDALAGIAKRDATNTPDVQINKLPAERTLRFKPELPTGAVIFASPVPSVYYKEWYLVLFLDRVIHRSLPRTLKTTLPLTVRPYYYRIELSIPAGQFPEPAEEDLLQEIQRLQFTPANPRDLLAARQETLAYMDSKDVREWFASHDISDRREEGARWLQSMTPDDLRGAARDLLIMNHVIATWAPKPRQTAVAVEDLRTAAASTTSSGKGGSPLAEARDFTGYPKLRFPAHTDAILSTPLPERLTSGVSLVASDINGVFVSGGALTRMDHDPTEEDVKSFQKHRSDRILVLTPKSSIDRARQLWSAFKGSSNGEIGVPKGKVSSGDLPALFILEVMLQLRVIQAGWWRDAEVRIDAGEGSALQIHADDEKRAQVLDWIKAIASEPMPDDSFVWAREVAIHRFDSVRADLQALSWERDPQGAIQDLQTISLKHVQDVARIYF